MGTTIRRMGSELLLNVDGNKYIAYPTNTGETWIVKITGGGPGPGPGDSDFVWPFALDYVTSEYRTAERPNHQGMDFSGGPAVQGKPMPAAAAGTVIIAGVYYGYGNTVVIDHGDVGGSNVKTLYGHQQRIDVSGGQAVTQGQTIGLVGNTGNSFGAHLHFEVWINGDGENGAKVNPRDFMVDHNPENEFVYG